MIVLDTHIWVWWVHGDERLTKVQVQTISANENDAIGISAISCWEIAKLVEYGRLDLPCSLDEWFEQAIAYPGIQLFPLTPRIAIESTRLPGEFHSDPADQIIVATARVYSCSLLTSDERILEYPHVKATH
ncbi:MAG: type II toxin-antitoxin system VapC family toxin [Thermodesulfobacteriota bacterium]